LHRAGPGRGAGIERGSGAGVLNVGWLRRRTTREREHEKRERARLWEGELRGRGLRFIGREREREREPGRGRNGRPWLQGANDGRRE
jgi:hypothetical protein